MRTTPYACQLLAATFLTLGCESNPTEPANQLPTSFAGLVSERIIETDPFSEVFDNPCNGTSVQITGEIVHHFHGVTDVPGTGLFLHWKDFYRVSGTGLGDDGTKYVFNDTDMQSFESPSPSALQATFTSFDGIRLVSKGVSPNFMVHARFHITV